MRKKLEFNSAIRSHLSFLSTQNHDPEPFFPFFKLIIKRGRLLFGNKVSRIQFHWSIQMKMLNILSKGLVEVRTHTNYLLPIKKKLSIWSIVSRYDNLNENIFLVQQYLLFASGRNGRLGLQRTEKLSCPIIRSEDIHLIKLNILTTKSDFRRRNLSYQGNV